MLFVLGFVDQIERLLNLLRDQMLTVAIGAALLAMVLTPIAFAILARLDWFRARRGRVMQKPEFWSVVCAMLLVMGLPAIFAAIAIKSQSFDANRYAFDPNRSFTILGQGRQFEQRDLLKAVEEADAAVSAERDRLAVIQKDLQDAVKKIDSQMIRLGEEAVKYPSSADALEAMVAPLGVMRKRVGVDAPARWEEIVAILEDPARRLQAQAPVMVAAGPAPGAAPSVVAPRNGLTPPEYAAALGPVPDAQRKIAVALPLDDVPVGWEVGRMGDRRLETFPAETMYEKINGRAESFLQYSATGMAFTSFRPQGRDDAAEVELYVFEFASPLKALGKYGTEKTDEAVVVAVGSEGYAADGSVSFHQDRYFVQVISPSKDDTYAAFAMEVARKVADRLSGKLPGAETPASTPATTAAGPVADVSSTTAPASPDYAADPTALFKLLPEGSGKKSPQYVAQDVFGYSFLSDVFLADYTAGADGWQGFLRPYTSADDAGSVFDRYLSNAREDGAKVEELTFPGADRAFIANNYDLNDIVFVRGNVLGGANGANRREPAEAYVKALISGLPAELPWKEQPKGESTPSDAGEP